MWERVRGLCYINKNVLQEYFTRGCARDSFTRVSLFVQMAWVMTRGLRDSGILFMLKNEFQVRNFISRLEKDACPDTKYLKNNICYIIYKKYIYIKNLFDAFYLL